MDNSNRVFVRDESGNQFGVDLTQGERFEIPEAFGRSRILYRFGENLWIEEHTNMHKSSRTYYTIDLIDVVYTFAEGEFGPEDLRPVLEYDVSWTCMWSPDEREDERNGAEMVQDRRASLFRLRNSMWAVFDLQCRAGDRPYQMLSNEEAVELLLREGYPPADLPDDLWEICEHRQLATHKSFSNGQQSEQLCRGHLPPASGSAIAQGEADFPLAQGVKAASEEWFRARLKEQVDAAVAEIGLLEDTVDFGAILAIAEPLLLEANGLAEWAQDDRLDDTGAEMLLRIGAQWLALESILDANRFGAKNAHWCTDNDRVGDAAQCLHDLARGVRKNAGWFKYLPDITTTCLLSLAPEACMGMPHGVFAKRLTVAVERLRKVLPLSGEERADRRQTDEDSEQEHRVVLAGHVERPVVLGKDKPVLTTAQYNVVKTVLDGGDAGLTKDKLVSKSGHEDARGILKRLAASDADWKQVIHFAGRTGGRYRIN